MGRGVQKVNCLILFTGTDDNARELAKCMIEKLPACYIIFNCRKSVGERLKTRLDEFAKENKIETEHQIIECIDFGDNFNEFTIDQTVEPFMHKAARHFKDKTGEKLMKMYLVLSSAIDTISGEISDHAHSIYHQYFLDNVVSYMPVLKMMRKVQRMFNTDNQSQVGLFVLDMIPDIDYVGNGSDINHCFSMMCMGRASLQILIDCFQMENDPNNPINVVHMKDIIDRKLINETKKIQNCRARTDDQKPNLVAASCFKTMFDPNLMMAQGARSININKNMPAKRNFGFW